MSQQIDTALVKQYHDTFERLLAQRGSKLRSAVRVESQSGEEQFWDQIGSVEAQEVITRHADSPQVDTPHARRRVTLRTYDVGDLFDTFDKAKMLGDPTSVYVQNFVDALGWKIDDAIVESFLGTAYTGKGGATSTVHPTANQIANDFSTAGTTTNLTINKLIEARRLLLSYQNDPDREPWYIACSANNLMSLLKTTQVTSVDYNTVKTLVRGEIDTFLGFKFIHSERLQSSANDRYVVAWPKSGVLCAMGKDITTEIARRPDKRFAWYGYACVMVGATRMQENKVIRISCDETK